MDEFIFVVSLKDFYGFQSYFAGLRLSYSVPSIGKIKIIFPYFHSDYINNLQLVRPQNYPDLNVEPETWGLISTFHTGKSGMVPDTIQIKSVLVEVESSQDSYQVKELVLGAIHDIFYRLSCVVPEIINFHQNDNASSIVKSISRCGKYSEIYLESHIHKNERYVDFELLGFVLANKVNLISKPYDRLRHAYKSWLNQSYREFYLDLATVVDYTCRWVIENEIVKRHCPSLDFKKINGYKKKMNILDEMGLLYSGEIVISEMMSIRNSLIHADHDIDSKNCNMYYNEVKNFLHFYKVPFFENQYDAIDVVKSKMVDYL